MTTSTTATHSSSRAAGRSSVVPPPAPPAGADADGAGEAMGLAPAEAPGVAGAPDWRPSSVIDVGEPGAMSLSLGSNRSTANRTGAFGSTGGALGTGVAVAPGARLAGLPGVAVAIGARDAPPVGPGVA